MALESIKALQEVAKQIEEMKNKAIDDGLKDRNVLRKKVANEILEYCKEAIDIEQNFYTESSISIFGDYKLSMALYSANKKWYVNFHEMKRYGSGSFSLTIYKDSTIDEFYSENGTKWKPGATKFIENWDIIKRDFESGLSNVIKQDIEKSQNELTRFKEECEKLNKLTEAE